MILYEDLFTMEYKPRKVDTIKKKMKKQKKVKDLWCVVIPSSNLGNHNLLEIYEYKDLLDAKYRSYHKDAIIIGIAIGNEEAVLLTAHILDRVYRSLECFDVKKYIQYDVHKATRMKD